MEKLPLTFTTKYPRTTNHYITGAPRLDKILPEPKIFGWYSPPIVSEAEIGAFQALLDIGSAAYLLLGDYWNTWWVYSTLISMEVGTGVIMGSFAALAILDESYIDKLRFARLGAIGSELAMAGLAWYAYADDTSIIDDIIVSLVVHPLNALTYFAFWLYTK